MYTMTEKNDVIREWDSVKGEIQKMWLHLIPKRQRENIPQSGLWLDNFSTDHASGPGLHQEDWTIVKVPLSWFD